MVAAPISIIHDRADLTGNNDDGVYKRRRFAQAEFHSAEMARLRSRVERLESDHRLGAAPTPEYQDLKGHQLPRAESRLVTAYNNLLKLEGKILETRRQAG